jgi:acyl-CoA thioesterase FadM
LARDYVDVLILRVVGGFTAALLDDMLGWTTFQEKDHLNDNLPAEIGIEQAKIFTAKLTVNYRRPVKLHGVYLVECKVSRVERVKKIWLECTVFDRDYNKLVEGDSLYIITGIDQEKAKALYSES